MVGFTYGFFGLSIFPYPFCIVDALVYHEFSDEYVPSWDAFISMQLETLSEVSSDQTYR